MKKFFTLLVVTLMTTFFVANATVILDENFNYAETNLNAVTGWTTSGTLTTGTGRNIETPALIYSNSGGAYINSGLGKQLRTEITSSSDYKNLKTITTLNSGVVYMTYLYKAGVIQSQSGVEICGLATGTSAGPRIWVGKSATTNKWKFGITRSSTSSSDCSWDAGEYADVNEVVLLVMKYDFSTLKASFYINPTIGASEPESPAAFDDSKGTGRTSLNAFWFRAQGSSMFKYSVGNVRISTTWAEAVASASPKLDAPLVGAATDITGIGFTANWTAVDDAVGYDVKVYNGATLAGTYNVSGQSTESLVIDNLNTGTAYTYTVTAKGDGINFSDSDPSDASEEIETLSVPQLSTPINGAASNLTSVGFTANWTAVDNALSYDVQVYQGVTLVGTYNKEGQASSSLVIDDLSSFTQYTYTVIAKGDGLNYANSEESLPSSIFRTLDPNAVNTIRTDLTDETWGTLYTSANQPSLGSFPSSLGLSNGFDLVKTFLYDISKYDFREDRKQNGLRVDRSSSGGMIVFPVVNSIEQMEIHAVPGGAPRDIVLKELVGSTWTTVGTYTQLSADYNVFYINISRSVPTKFRIENPASGQSTIYQIITRTTAPSLLATPTVGAASDATSDGFTANWTAVENATGYTVRVYQGATMVGTYNASGQATENLIITGLDSSTEYTYKVIAKGDNEVTYLDSYISAASLGVTTLEGESPTNYFRSTGDGEWTGDSSWESSPDNSSWSPVNNAPGNQAAAVKIMHKITVPDAQSVSADKIVVEADGQLLNEGTLTIEGELVFVVDASGTAQLLNNGTVTNNGKVIVRRTFKPEDGWVFIGFPFNVSENGIFIGGTTTPAVWGNLNDTDKDFYIAEYDAQKRDQTGIAVVTNSPNWKDVEARVLVANKGYIIGVEDEITLDFVSETGQTAMFDTEADETLNTYTTNAQVAHHSWNLLAIPFTSAFDLEQASQDQTPFYYFNGITYASIMSGESFETNPFTSFFVQANPAAATPTTLSFASAGRLVKAASVKDFSEIGLVVKNAKYEDKTRIRLQDGASADYEIGKDAMKFFSHKAGVPQIACKQGELDLSVNSVPANTTQVEVTVTITEDGTYTISLDGAAEGCSQVILVDGEVETDLLANEYSFAGTAGSTKNMSVLLVTDGTTAVGTTEGGSILIQAIADKAYIGGLDGAAVVNVYDVAGKLVQRFTGVNNGDALTLNNAGVAIIEVKTATQNAKAKVSVKK
jgi:hypothetical protein